MPAKKRASSSSSRKNSRAVKATGRQMKVARGKSGAPRAVGKPDGATSPSKRRIPASSGRPAPKNEANSNGRVHKRSTKQDTSPPEREAEETVRKVRTHLSAKELKEFRQLLLDKRAELAGDVQRLTSEALHRDDNGNNDHPTMPIHMADIGSDNWEQDFTLGLIASEAGLVREIDQALARIADRTYGVCEATGKPIGLARLRAKPWAKYCIEYARMREEGRAP